MVEYDLMRPWLSLDPWQKEYIETETDCLLVAGRQVGKTAAMGIKIGERARRPKRDILIGALTEKQAYQVYFKALNYVMTRYPKLIKGGKEKPTKHEFRLKNPGGDSVVRAYALGLTGMGMRTFTITDLFIDECREIAREVFVSLEPMLSVTKGTKDYASTPGGKRGYFWEMSDPKFNFKKFHVSAEDCPRHTKEFLEKQRNSMSRVEYAQEYLGQFLDEVLRVFSDELLLKTCVLMRKTECAGGCLYGGVDVGRMGDSESTFEIIRRISRDSSEQVESLATTKTYTTDTTNKILELQRKFKIKMWGIDGGGVGGGVLD